MCWMCARCRADVGDNVSRLLADDPRVSPSGTAPGCLFWFLVAISICRGTRLWQVGQPAFDDRGHARPTRRPFDSKGGPAAQSETMERRQKSCGRRQGGTRLSCQSLERLSDASAAAVCREGMNITLPFPPSRPPSGHRGGARATIGRKDSEASRGSLMRLLEEWDVPSGRIAKLLWGNHSKSKSRPIWQPFCRTPDQRDAAESATTGRSSGYPASKGDGMKVKAHACFAVVALTASSLWGLCWNSEMVGKKRQRTLLEKSDKLSKVPSLVIGASTRV